MDFSRRRTCVHLRALFRTSHGVKVIRVQPCRPHFLPGGEPSEILENIFTASRSKDRQLRLAALVLRGLRLHGDLSRRVDSVLSVRTTPLIFQISYTKLDLRRLHHSDIPRNPETTLLNNFPYGSDRWSVLFFSVFAFDFTDDILQNAITRL